MQVGRLTANSFICFLLAFFGLLDRWDNSLASATGAGYNRNAFAPLVKSRGEWIGSSVPEAHPEIHRLRHSLKTARASFRYGKFPLTQTLRCPAT